MIGWLIFLGYVAVWLLYGWRLTAYLLDREIRRWMKEFTHLNGSEGVAQSKSDLLGPYLLAGFGLALIWPVVAPVRGAWHLLAGTGLFRLSVEREYAEREELEQLRKLARKHGLPMPEVKPWVPKSGR